MPGRCRDRVPFLEWGRDEIVIENKVTGQRTTRLTKFIRGNWLGKMIFATFAVAVVASLFLIPSQAAAFLRWALSRMA